MQYVDAAGRLERRGALLSAYDMSGYATVLAFAQSKVTETSDGHVQMRPGCSTVEMLNI